MNASKDFVEYIERRFKSASTQEEKFKHDDEEQFKHIYHMGEASAFRELLMILKQAA